MASPAHADSPARRPVDWLPVALGAALADGAVAVTPNERIARAVRSAYDRGLILGGATAWETPVVASWQVWLQSLWEAAVVGGAVPRPPMLLSAWQAGGVWREAVVRSSTPAGLLHPRQAAQLAQQAWDLFHDWRATDGESLGGFPRVALNEDATAFFGWARQFERRCREQHWIDRGRLAPELAGLAARGGLTLPRAIRLVGFVELTPAQDRLVETLRAAGVEVGADRLVTAADPQAIRAEPARDEIEELFAAAGWARIQAGRMPGARVAVVVPRLETLRSEALRAFEQTISPGRATAPDGTTAPPFNISLGLPLASAPLVGSALTILALSVGPVTLAEAGHLLVSAHLAAAARRHGCRSAAERRLVERGGAQIALSTLIAELGEEDPHLAAQWGGWLRAIRALPARLPPSDWRTRFDAWLDAAGWLRREEGDPALSSAEFQQREVFAELLDRWAGIGVVHASMTAREAVTSVRELAAEHLFQPESGDAPVQILGELEADGLPFDALRVCGLTAEDWPKAPQPHPFLPVAWQRQRNVPRAGAKRERAYAQRMLAGFAGAAPAVVFSWPMRRGDAPIAPSPMLAAPGGARNEVSAIAVDTAPVAHALRAGATPLEIFEDARLPPLVQGAAVRGGASVLEHQSECPFRAAASFRLAAEPWPEVVFGPTPAERGTMVHAALRALWDGVGDQAAMRGLGAEARAARVAAASEAGARALGSARWAQLPALLVEEERQRLRRLLTKWLEYDLGRTPFVVLALEQRQRVHVGGLVLDVRIDRVDRVADGLLIIDYKTGRPLATSRFAERRPDGRLALPQLPLYLRALEPAAAGAAVSALVYASVRADGISVSGVAREESAWKGVDDFAAASRGQFADWAALLEYWRAGAERLAVSFREGACEVAPRTFPESCRYCAHRAVCRIEEFRERDGLPTMIDEADSSDGGNN